MSKKMKKSDRIEKIGKAIEQTAKDMDLYPSEVTKQMLLNGDQVSDWDLKMVGGLGTVKSALFPEEKDLVSVSKIKAQKNYVGSLEKQLSIKLNLEESILQALSSLKPVSVKPYKVSSKKKISRALNLVLSDLHFGSDILGEETGNVNYGKTEEARRFAAVVKQTIEYKPEYRNETQLNVLLLGDIIQNLLHDPRAGATVTEQFVRALHLIEQALGQFSAAFPKITVYCNPGNHGRLTSRHHQRATNQKWDSIEGMIYEALKYACKSLKNVTFVNPKTPFVSFEVFGQKIFATHGDTVLNVGYPGKVIKTGALETQINRINATLPDAKEYSVFILGHVHVASVTHLSNGSVLITNGALVPTDEYAVSIGLMESEAGQWLFESVEGFPVGDMRFIKVNEDTDKDSSLDKIIKNI